MKEICNVWCIVGKPFGVQLCYLLDTLIIKGVGVCVCLSH